MAGNSSTTAFISGILFVIVLLVIYYCYSSFELKSCKEKVKQTDTTSGTPPEPMYIPPVAQPVAGLVPKYSESNLEGFLSKESDSDLHYDPALMTLDASVYRDHQEFVKEATIKSAGAVRARDVIRDDAMDINPRVGIRRTNYSDFYSDENARTVPSEYTDQMVQKTGQFVL